MNIDALYESFCTSLPEELRALGRALACELRLAPTPDVPWSAVFKNRVTLEAPLLFIDAIARVDSDSVERAVLAHMLAVIEAFGTDRLEDGQVDDKPELRGLLACVRKARNDALFRLSGDRAVRMATAADRQTLDAIAAERKLLLDGSAVDVITYEAVSAGKQSVGIPATVALAELGALPPEKLDTIRTTLLSVWLGLQFRDDVLDWEDDARRGGAWAIVLARKRLQRDAEGRAPADAVAAAGVLGDMLDMAAARFRTALAGAESLGLARLAEWLRARESETLELREGERKSPGYVRRAALLAPWAAEVLA